MKKDKLVIATNNPGKAREIKKILEDVYAQVVSLKDEGIVADVVEDGDTFLANARKKALEISLMTDADVVADDSGLCVDGLDGRPGVYSARYSKEGTDEANNQKLVEEVTPLDAKGREAHYACAIVLAHQGQVLFQCEGTCDGEILTAPRGTGGFGYDPYFLLPEYGQTFGELPPETKNQISHRARALAQLADFCKSHER